MKKVFAVAVITVFALASCRTGSHAKQPHCPAYGGSAPSAIKKLNVVKAESKTNISSLEDIAPLED